MISSPLRPPSEDAPAGAAAGRSAAGWRRARWGFGAGVLVLAAALVVLLSQSAPRLAGTNDVFARFANVALEGGQVACQPGTVPGGTAAVRVAVAPGVADGPALGVWVQDGAGRTVARGERGAGWGGDAVDVPVGAVPRTLARGQVCIAPAAPLTLRGYAAGSPPTAILVDGTRTRESVRLWFFRAGSESWWSVAPVVGKRMGQARGAVLDGGWVGWAWAGLVLALLAAVAATVWSLGRRAARTRLGVPVAGWLCALVAVLSGVTWSIATPPFHVPDEVSHLAYAQYLAETGRLPEANGDLEYAREEENMLAATLFYYVVGDVAARPPWTEAEDAAMDALPAAGRVSSGSAQSSSNNPPLYYALQGIPYGAGRMLGLSFLDRLALMRLLSVLLFAVTALAAFLFVRELVPGTPWAWTLGGLAVALQALAGFISSGVQADALLYCASALLLLALARAFRRGLGVGTGAAIGAAVAVGMLGKLTFAGLVPGAALGVLLLVRRAGRDGARRARRGALAAAGVAGTAIAAYAVACVVVWDRSPFTASVGPVTTAGPATAAAGAARGLREGASYLWQLYLPRLPFMDDQFPGANPMPSLWVHGLIGHFGWLEASWPEAVYRSARWVLVAIALLALAELFRAWRAGRLRGRGAELLTYAAVGAGLLGLLGWAGHQARVGDVEGFQQARYLLPLLPFYAAAVALAARRLGRRLAPVRGRRLRGGRLRARAARAAAHDLPLLRMSVVSVALPVRDGAAHLDAVLAAVRAQRVDRPVEIVIVDSGSTDGSPDIARAHGARVEEIPPAAFSHGATRNRLMELAAGDHVAFLTQDAEPADEHWLARLLEGFALAGDVGLTCGPYRPRPGASPMVARELEDWFASFSADGAPRVDRATGEPAPGPACFFSSANGCVSRAAWRRVPFRARAVRGGPAARGRHAARRLREGLPPGRRGLHSHDYAPLEGLGACSTSSARCARSTASGAPLAPRAVLGRIRREVARDRAWARKHGLADPRAARAALSHPARARRGARHARRPPARRGPPAALARAARDLRAHPPVTSLLRFRLVRHLVAVFGDLPRRAVLTWRHLGPRETLRRALLFPAARDPVRLAPRARRRGCRTRARARCGGTGATRCPVAVVIPTYGPPDLVAAAVRSIRATTRRGRVRIIVCDDGSAPEHVAGLERINGIELVRGERQAGFAANVEPRPAAGAPGRGRGPAQLRRDRAPRLAGAAPALGPPGARRGHRRAEAAVRRRHDPVGRARSATRARRSGSTTRYRGRPGDHPPANVPQPCLAMTGAALYVRRHARRRRPAGRGLRHGLRGRRLVPARLGGRLPRPVLPAGEPDASGVQDARARRRASGSWPRSGASGTRWGAWFDEREVRAEDGGLRIVYVTEGTGVGGGHRVVFQHLEGLAARGHHCELWTLGDPPDWFDLGVPVRSFPSYGDLSASWPGWTRSRWRPGGRPRRRCGRPPCGAGGPPTSCRTSRRATTPRTTASTAPCWPRTGRSSTSCARLAGWRSSCAGWA